MKRAKDVKDDMEEGESKSKCVKSEDGCVVKSTDHRSPVAPDVCAVPEPVAVPGPSTGPEPGQSTEPEPGQSTEPEPSPTAPDVCVVPEPVAVPGPSTGPEPGQSTEPEPSPTAPDVCVVPEPAAVPGPSTGPEPGQSTEPEPGQSTEPEPSPTAPDVCVVPEPAAVPGQSTEPDESPVGPNLLDISDDVLLIIFAHLRPPDLFSLSQTCARLSELTQDRTLWLHVDARGRPADGRFANFCLERLRPATATFAMEFPPDPTSVLYLCCPLDDMVRQLAVSCRAITELTLENVAIDASLTRYKDLPRTLKHLSLKGSSMLNPPAKHSYFHGCNHHTPDLQVLILTDCLWFEPHSIMVVAKCERLRELRLNGCEGLGNCMAYCSMAARFAFHSLETLDLRNTRMNNSDVACFNVVSSLRHLYLSGPAGGRFLRPRPPARVGDGVAGGAGGGVHDPGYLIVLTRVGDQFRRSIECFPGMLQMPPQGDNADNLPVVPAPSIHSPRFTLRTHGIRYSVQPVRHSRHPPPPLPGDRPRDHLVPANYPCQRVVASDNMPPPPPPPPAERGMDSAGEAGKPERKMYYVSMQVDFANNNTNVAGCSVDIGADRYGEGPSDERNIGRGGNSAGPSKARGDESAGPSKARGDESAGPSKARGDESAGPSKARGDDSAGPSKARGDESVGPSKARGDESAGPSKVRGDNNDAGRSRIRGDIKSARPSTVRGVIKSARPSTVRGVDNNAGPSKVPVDKSAGPSRVGGGPSPVPPPPRRPPLPEQIIRILDRRHQMGRNGGGPGDDVGNLMRFGVTPVVYGPPVFNPVAGVPFVTERVLYSSRILNLDAGVPNIAEPVEDDPNVVEPVEDDPNVVEPVEDDPRNDRLGVDDLVEGEVVVNDQFEVSVKLEREQLPIGSRRIAPDKRPAACEGDGVVKRKADEMANGEDECEDDEKTKGDKKMKGDERLMPVEVANGNDESEEEDDEDDDENSDDDRDRVELHNYELCVVREERGRPARPRVRLHRLPLARRQDAAAPARLSNATVTSATPVEAYITDYAVFDLFSNYRHAGTDGGPNITIRMYGARPAVGRLETLILRDYPRITDASLQVFADVTTLREVDVTNTSVTRRGVETFKAKRPDVKITSNFD